MKREFTGERNTNETEIKICLNIDGTGTNTISTGVGFLDHMLTLFSKHGFFDLKVEAKGDLYVDSHHTVEDVGILLGKAIKTALGDKTSIKRYGSFLLPMDEALVLCAVDISGRPFLVFDADLPRGMVGTLDIEMVEEFFRAVAVNSEICLHIKVMHGKNVHHIIEGMFKAFGRALDEAISIDSRIKGVMSTKGVL